MPAANGIMVKCHQCGKEIYRPQWHLKRQEYHFCDTICKGLWQRTQTGENANAYKGTRVKVQCSHCGKPLERDPAKVERNDHFFCNAVCYAAWKKSAFVGEGNPNFTTPAIDTACAWCGVAIKRKPWKFGTDKRKRHFCCPEHRAEWTKRNIRGATSPTWKGGQLKYYGPNWREQRRLARERDAGKCRICGKTEKKIGKALDVHHITPFRSFGYIPEQNENYLQANALNNLVCLCHSCHKKVESGKLALQPNLL